MSSNLETWKNVSPAPYAIFFFQQPDNVMSAKQRILKGGAEFQITAAERKYNTDIYTNADNVPFVNGTFISVDEVSEEVSFEEVKASPASFQDKDLEAKLGEHFSKLQSFLDEQTNVVTVQRMLTIAKDKDFSTKVVERVEGRYNEMVEDATGPVEVGTVVDDDSDDGVDPAVDEQVTMVEAETED